MKNKYLLTLILCFLTLNFAFAINKTVSFKCKGIATFELVGSSGKKGRSKNAHI